MLADLKTITIPSRCEEVDDATELIGVMITGSLPLEQKRATIAEELPGLRPENIVMESKDEQRFGSKRSDSPDQLADRSLAGAMFDGTMACETDESSLATGLRDNLSSIGWRVK